MFEKVNKATMEALLSMCKRRRTRWRCTRKICCSGGLPGLSAEPLQQTLDYSDTSMGSPPILRCSSRQRRKLWAARREKAVSAMGSQ